MSWTCTPPCCVDQNRSAPLLTSPSPTECWFVNWAPTRPFQLSIAGEQCVLLVPEGAPGLAGDVVALLSGLEQRRSVPVIRRVQGRRAVEGRAHRERVEEPARLDSEPASEGPCLVHALVGLGAIEVIAPEM